MRRQILALVVGLMWSTVRIGGLVAFALWVLTADAIRRHAAMLVWTIVAAGGGVAVVLILVKAVGGR